MHSKRRSLRDSPQGVGLPRLTASVQPGSGSPWRSVSMVTKDRTRRTTASSWRQCIRTVLSWSYTGLVGSWGRLGHGVRKQLRLDFSSAFGPGERALSCIRRRGLSRAALFRAYRGRKTFWRGNPYERQDHRRPARRAPPLP